MIGSMKGTNSDFRKAWVVECKKCSCTITCRAIDTQLEHSQPDKADPPPKEAVIVTSSCCWSPFRYGPSEVFKGAPGPSSKCREQKDHSNQESKKANNAILIAASLIAAVRLNREEIKSSPSVSSKIDDSIRLAKMIEARLHQ